MLASRIQSRTLATLLTVVFSLLVPACQQGSATEPGPTLEPGRVSIRQGGVTPRPPFSEANFSAVLPEGWGAVDTLNSPLVSSGEPANGILGKMGEAHMQVKYAITPPGSQPDFYMLPGHVRSQSEIDGVTIDWLLPEDMERGLFTVGISFPWLPGDPDRHFGLAFVASGLHPSQYLEVKQIVESVRYLAEPAVQRPVPSPEITPAPDWVRVGAQWDSHSEPIFSILAPPGTVFAGEHGIDSLPGSFTVGDLQIDFDFGPLGAQPTIQDGHLRYPDNAEQQYWLEMVRGEPFMMYRPAEEQPTGTAYTGISTSRIPGPADITMPGGSPGSSMPGCGGAFWARDIERDEQELFLAILRTLHTEGDRGPCR